MNAVSPGEEFICHLGVEQGIKVIYRPMFKYRDGHSTSSKYASLTFKQTIEMKNTFDRAVRIMVVDQVPVSGEEKIKVSS
ncbi:unnamed protein product [Protopolystoma xenopodis]|uniref:DUF4139 domain-containing protein n=1 Tax=Protopolystoma xenopodis TaxID=117903 RepID=A0A448X4M8_9PLAT|nr:unnamed protein product [Protopolystoma xenopodis]